MTSYKNLFQYKNMSGVHAYKRECRIKVIKKGAAFLLLPECFFGSFFFWVRNESFYTRGDNIVIWFIVYQISFSESFYNKWSTLLNQVKYILIPSLYIEELGNGLFFSLLCSLVNIIYCNAECRFLFSSAK